MRTNLAFIAFLLLLIFPSYSYQKATTIYLIGDSTVADYSLEEDYENRRYPVVGWGADVPTVFCPR